MWPSNRPGPRKHAARRAKEVNYQMQWLLELFDSSNTEHRLEIDFNQIGKCLQHENHLTLRAGHQAPLKPDIPGERNQGLARGVRRVRQGH